VRRADLTPRGAEQNPQPTLASEDAFEQVPGNAWTAFHFSTCSTSPPTVPFLTMRWTPLFGPKNAEFKLDFQALLD
jgi:hypothetical protein